ncbi:zinc transporter [Plasmodium gonderi]|uniref:Zinc transporter n=1 Tax=Plasmodium gonderi TaxID=77519 RepID=A0A1Y1JF07_PLAGO|nr:zinc transporter [Plasmodium gonderi]GAW79925.1 zinc transporter [Plasmodium gonderi]
MWLTIILTLLIFIECVAVVYIPSKVENRLSKMKKNKFLNMENFENIASGAILALAFIHMLPEVITLLNKNNISLYYTFSLILISVTFLNITDMLHDHHMEHSFNINDTLESENQNNSVMSDKKNDTNCLPLDMNETLRIEISALDDKKSKCKNNFFLEIFKSNSFFIVLSLFIHSFIEGLLMGSLKDKKAIVIVALSMLAHKWAECLIVYKNIVNKIENTFLANIYSWSFILSLPIGVFIATFSFPSNEFVEIIFSSIACGFFLYLSFNMTKEIKVTKHNKYFLSSSYFLGVCGMSALMIIFNSFEDANIV